MGRSRIVWALLLASAAGCGGGAAETRPGPLFEGRIDGAPSMQSLPDPDVVDSALSPRMRAGLGLAAEAFDVAPPEPPIVHDAASLQAWSDGELTRWLADKSRAVDEARRELDAAAEESHRQRIMGGAVVGLMYEDIVHVLLDIPTPTELLEEPEIADAYQDVLLHQASTYLEQARRAYRACAANAEQLEPMSHWSSFCAARRESLPRGRGGT